MKRGLELNADGFAGNHQTAFLRGAGLYGETWRVTLPSERPFEPTDTFRGVFEKLGEVYLYPLKTKETPNQSNSSVIVNLEGV